MFPSPAIELARDKQKDIFGRWVSRVRGLKEFAGELPVSTMADELLTEGDGQVKAFITICGNPVLSSPGGVRLDQALSNIDFMVSIDNYINETTRHADIILPTPTGLEVEHYDLIFNTISVTDNVKFSPATVPVNNDRPADWLILKTLASRLGHVPWFERWLTPRRLVNLGLMFGAYGRLSHPKRWFSGLSLKQLALHPHGIALGQLKPAVPQRMNTLDKKVHLAPAVFVEQLRELLADSLPDNGMAIADASSQQSMVLSLIGRRNVYTNNSWMHQVSLLNKSKQVRCTAMISLEDAEHLSVMSGDILGVASRLGEIFLPAEVTETMMTGVISIPHGFGHQRAHTQVPIADKKPGVSVNDVTDPLVIDTLTGNAAFSGQHLSIRRVSGTAVEHTLSGKPLTVLFASQSGNAEMVAYDVKEQAGEYGLLAHIVDSNEASLEDITSSARLLMIVSTFGEGNMPDSAERLWQQITQIDGLDLSALHFSVLALGDRSYEHFCQAGIDWHHYLSNTGAHEVGALQLCDVDYTETAEAWLHQVLPILSASGDQTMVAVEQKQSPHKVQRFSRSNPLIFRLIERYRLNSVASSKEVWHYTLQFDASRTGYTAGDALYLIPENADTLVEKWLEYLAPFKEAWPDDVKKRLKHAEIRLPTTKLVDYIAKHAPEFAVLMQDKKQRDAYLWGKDTLEILGLHHLPQNVIELEQLLDTLSPIQTRAYSIASGPSGSTNTVSLTVAKVCYAANNHTLPVHQGVASCYLAHSLPLHGEIKGYFVSNRSFSIPQNAEAPIIMVGPGTGIAPFIGFLQERAALGHKGKNWLFFGERNQAQDFFYKEWLQTLRDQEVLTHLDTAFSRDQDEKIYVQDRLQMQAQQVYQWLEEGAYFFVCGDGESMAPAVEKTLISIVASQGRKTQEDAATYVEALSHAKRYVKDVY